MISYDAGHDLRPNGRASAWELAEFAFCPRAGWIARRAGHTGDTFVEDDDSYGSLGFLPDYDADVLREVLRRMAGQLIFSVGLAGVLGVTFLVLHDWVWAGFLWTGVGLLLPLVCWWVVMVRRCWGVWWYLRKHLGRAVAREVPADLNRAVEWNWWDFHRAGFAVVKPKAAYLDPTLDLDGRPWRLLVRGSLRVPVFRKHKGGPSAGPSQFAALAAYSHLIGVCERAESPFGVILFPDRWTVLVVPTGYSVPPTPVAVEQFRRTLADASPPAEPSNAGSRCRGCPHGEPRELVTDRPASSADRNGGWDASSPPAPSIHVIDGRSVSPHPSNANNGSRYHSLCGDLFRWVPPHDRAVRLALTLVEPAEPVEPDPVPQVVTPIQVVVNNNFPGSTHPAAAAIIQPMIETTQNPVPFPAGPPAVHPRAETPRVAPAGTDPSNKEASKRPEVPDDDEAFGAGIL